MALFGPEIKDAGIYVKIVGFPIRTFQADLRRTYKSSRIAHIFSNTFMFFGKGTMTVHRFFLPEMVYILNQLPSRKKYIQTVNNILTLTWMKSTQKEYPSKVDMSKMSDMVYTPKSYQSEFLKLYDTKKQQYLLRGYILAFEQGLGKTFTSLSLMHCLGKDAVVVIAPKSTLKTVWRNEIGEIFKSKQDVWVVGDPPKKARFYILNYESIDKVSQVIQYIKLTNKIGIIVSLIY